MADALDKTIDDPQSGVVVTADTMNVPSAMRHLYATSREPADRTARSLRPRKPRDPDARRPRRSRAGLDHGSGSFPRTSGRSSTNGICSAIDHKENTMSDTFIDWKRRPVAARGRDLRLTVAPPATTQQADLKERAGA